MKNFLTRLIKGAPGDEADLAAQLDEIASVDSKPSFGGGLTIREISQSLHGVDVRTLWRDGYSDKQIKNLMADEYNLMELYEKQPLGNNKSAKGREILAKLKP